MDTIVEYMLKSFRKVKADAVPQSPRPSKVEKILPNQETYSTHEPEVEDREDFAENEENTTPPKSCKKKNKSQENGKKKKSKSNNREPQGNNNIIINAEAGENIVTIINSNNLHFGPTINFGLPDVKRPKPDNFVDPEEVIEKTDHIQLLFDANIKPEPKYLMYVKNNLGNNWRCIFVKLGFTREEIEELETEYKSYGVEEARYQLLRQWVKRNKKNTLGQLARFLWHANERRIVKELAEMYDKEP